MLGCGSIGDIYQRGIGVQKNYNKARKFYTKSCDGGEMGGCGALGDLYAYGLGVKPSYTKSIELYKQACDGGKKIACDRLLDKFVGSVEDLNIKCNEKDMDACIALAGKYDQQKDYEKVFEYIEKACNGGVMIACTSQGYLYQAGLGVKKNIKKALQFYDKSCNGGEKEVCVILGEIYEGGVKDDINIDFEKALTFYKKACELEDDKACNNFKTLYDKECTDNSTKPQKFCKKYK